MSKSSPWCCCRSRLCFYPSSPLQRQLWWEVGERSGGVKTADWAHEELVMTKWKHRWEGRDQARKLQMTAGCCWAWWEEGVKVDGQRRGMFFFLPPSHTPSFFFSLYPCLLSPPPPCVPLTTFIPPSFHPTTHLRSLLGSVPIRPASLHPLSVPSRLLCGSFFHKCWGTFVWQRPPKWLFQARVQYICFFFFLHRITCSLNLSGFNRGP